MPVSPHSTGRGFEKLIELPSFEETEIWVTSSGMAGESAEGEVGEEEKPGKPGGHGASLAGVEAEELEKRELEITDGAFHSRLKSVLTDNKYDRHLRGRRRGKLDMRHLFKIPMGYENVFMQKNAIKGKKYNIGILVDESGSMYGPKIDTAAQIAMFLTKQFEKVGINFGVFGFNSNVIAHKDFNESKKDLGKIDAKMRQRTRGYCGGGNSGVNNDYLCAKETLEKFKKFPGEENVMIWLSDGYPACGCPECIRSYTENHNSPEVIRHMVNSYDMLVKTIGIGIMSDSRQIPNYRKVNNLKTLKPIILEELKKRIKR